MSMQPISRRTLLRGLGAAVAVPWLDAMTPAFARTTSAPFPTRLGFIYVPNGKNMDDWTPKTEGAEYELPSILQPLKDLKGDFSILTGLTADKARAHGDGGGDHARALAAFLTGAQPRKTDGTDIRAGVSVDQVAASAIGDQTRLSSLEIGCEAGSMAGNCDSGYSCVYSSTMSWRSATQPLPKEVNPKSVFDRLFGGGSATERAKTRAQRQSVIDLVREDYKELNGRVGRQDQQKLDEYISSIRDIEVRLERAVHMPEVKVPDGVARPTGIPASYEEHIKLMGDLFVLAFQADVTRVATFVVANEGSNKPYAFIGVPEGHHDLSHHGGAADKKSKIAKINAFHTQMLAYTLGKLKSVKEGDGTLLDHCLIAYGSGNSDGNAHNHDNLPLLLAGTGGGAFKTGRHVRFAKETPLNNLWLALLQRVGVKLQSLGDSTGVLTV
ncbi:MAG TPA: DUF1552 domain-containing protein [Planctomycetota bacterium]|jgi:hypothetical protein|nr:DUF1552 domain-containing protein [Planctomycetota bacterium]